MAYQENDIVALARETFKKWQAANPQSAFKKKDYKEKHPEYYAGYHLCCDYAEHIRDHSTVGRFPEKLFAERSPNQTEKEAKYIRQIYKQVTLPVFVDYLSTITRGDNPNNVNIVYEKDESESSLQQYLEKGIKDYGSLEVWRKTVLPATKTIDANGIICVKPYQVPTVTIEPTEEYPEERTFIAPDLLEPIPYYYPCEKIVSYSSDEYYMVEMDEKSEVIVGTKTEKIGKIYEFIDDENIWRVIQYGKQNEGLFRLELYYPHGEGIVPVTVLGGIPVIYDGKVIWQSPYLYSVDLLDLVALNQSNKQVSINTCVYPYAIAIGAACNFEYKDRNGLIRNCNDGYVYDSVVEKDIICPSCEGVGLKDRRSPLGVLLLKPGTAREPGEETFKNKPLEFVSPEVTTLEFLDKTIEKDTQKARQILHLQTTGSSVKGQPDMLATVAALDNQSMQAFAIAVMTQNFDITRFVIDRIGYQRYGDAYKAPTLSTPTSVDFLSAEDYMVQVGEAVKAGLPPFMIRAIILKFLQAVFYNQKEAISVFEIVTDADRILIMNEQDTSIGLAKGTIARWEKVLHDSAISLVQELIRDNPSYLEQELNVKIEELKTKAKEVADAIVVNTGQPTTENILNTLVS